MRNATRQQPSFADLELQTQGLSLDATLRGIADFLDTHAELIEMVREDLVRGLKRPQTGREGINAEQVLRSFVLKSVKNWDLRELAERTADGYSLRRFTTFFSQRVPRHDAFHRAFTRLTPRTLQALNNAVVRAGVEMGVEDGSKMRADTTVVETNIHFPTDSTLLYDCVRVVTRLVRQLRKTLPALSGGRFPNHTRRARRRMQEIQRMTPKQRHEEQVPKYRELIRITAKVVACARELLALARETSPADPLCALTFKSLAEEIEHYLSLADRVIHQARRRVLEGQQVPNSEKIFSIFQPHTHLIKRGKAEKPVEFGHKVLLAESGIGLITDYRILAGNPPDEIHVVPCLEHHKEMFGVSPQLFAADRGFYSQANVAACQNAGVLTECFPQRGGRKSPERKAHEKSRAFRRGQRFRAGIEGRISVLFRGRGMKRCLLDGPERFELCVGAAVLANNLIAIARELNRRCARRPRAA